MSLSGFEFSRFRRIGLVALIGLWLAGVQVYAQGKDFAGKARRQTRVNTIEHTRRREEWFLRGRNVPGKPAAELRHKAYRAKMAARAADRASQHRKGVFGSPSQITAAWVPLGPVPLASDATGDGFQNYNQVSGRATAVAVDPADPSGNTVYVGGAQGGIWKSANAANSTPTDVNWTPLTDDQPTLSIGAIAIQPGNPNPANSMIVAGTGEADDSTDSYFGLGMLSSSDGGNSWVLTSTANGGSLSFAGLGASRIAFSTITTDTVVAATGIANEGIVSGAANADTYPGLYTSTNAGQTWTYDELSPGGAAQATSATSVAFNAAAVINGVTGQFFAAVRYQGFFSSPDGLTWTRLPNQPGSPGLLSAAACPQNYVTTCPIFRGEISVVPGRNEMYVWFVSADTNGSPVDQGIWQTLDAGSTWSQIFDTGIANCGDIDGCGVEQGFYNLELLALPNGSATDLYAGAINLYKCSITLANPYCANTPFVNLTHAYGCDPLGAPAHVHPDQHALAYMIPTAGIDSGADLMYFANDGGIYRALNGFTGLTSGSCSGTNLFDDLNQNLGSMTQFVAFSESPSDPNTMLGGTEGNGSPATASAMTSSGWGNVLGADGGYNAIDPGSGNFFASNPDTGFGTLAIQECSSGINCNDSLFNVAVSSSDLDGDDGAFYFPYILDPQSNSTMLVGTCRVWRGPPAGGAFTLLSPNFDTFGTGTCSGSEVNTVRSLAAGGPANPAGSQVIYATTDGPGPNDLGLVTGGNVWVTTNATQFSGGNSTFTNVTLNGPGGTTINPNQFPISSVAIDASDPTGNTAYVTIMGFTGGPGHVWQTTNAGASWIDFTGFGPNNLPDSPTNATVVDWQAHVVYVGTDVGVFASSTSTPAWTEVGPNPATQGSVGFLPNAAVTSLVLYNEPGQKLLRASTYGRGVWQIDLLPDFQISFSNSSPTPTIFADQAFSFNGTLTAVNSYNSSVQLTCISGSTAPPSPCGASPDPVTPTAAGAPFTLNIGPSSAGSYGFNAQGTGNDPEGTTHLFPLTLNVVDFGLTPPVPDNVNVPPGAASAPVSFEATAAGPFDQPVAVGCSFNPNLPGAGCVLTPGSTVYPTSSSPVNMTASVTVPPSAGQGAYSVTLQATTNGAPAPKTQSFELTISARQDFTINSSPTKETILAGQTAGPYNLTIAPTGPAFDGEITLSCSNVPTGASCSFSQNPVLPGPGAAQIALNIATSNTTPAGSYPVLVTGTSNTISHSVTVTVVVENSLQLLLVQPFPVSVDAGSEQSATVSLTANYSGTVNANCDASALGGQCSITPGNPISISAQAPISLLVVVNIPNGAAPKPSNSYNVIVTVTDISGLPSQKLSVPLTVIQDFSLSFTSGTNQRISAGFSASYSLSLQPQPAGSSFAGDITFSCSGSPADCIFTPDHVTPGNNTAAVSLNIATVPSTPAGNDSVEITAASGSLTHAVTASLTVLKTITLASQQAFPSADAGSRATATLALTANYASSLSATCDASQFSGQCSLSPPNYIQAGSGTAIPVTLTVNIPDTAAPHSTNSYKVDVNVGDVSGSPNQLLAVPLTVIQDFDLSSVTPASQTISVGQSATYNFNVLPVGAIFGAPVSLSCSGLPSPCTFSPASVTPGGNLAAVVMTIDTTTSSAKSFRDGPGNMGILYSAWMLAAGIEAASAVCSKKRRTRFSACLGVIVLAFCLNSCGAAGSNGGGGSLGGSGGGPGVGGQHQGTQPGTYNIRVVGTSGTLIHQSAPVKLVVNSQ